MVENVKIYKHLFGMYKVLLTLCQSAVHYVKSVRIRSFSGPQFPAFGLNTDIYYVNPRVQFECGEMRTIKTPNMYTFHAVVWLGQFKVSLRIIKIFTTLTTLKVAKQLLKPSFPQYPLIPYSRLYHLRVYLHPRLMHNSQMLRKT